MSSDRSHVKGLTPTLIQEIERYLLVKTEIRHADLCFLFGGGRSADARVAEAFRLWQNGFFDLVVVSGGPSDVHHTTEADLMADKLVGLGVPGSKIVIENKSKSTIENVVFSMQLLQQKGLFESINSLIAVGVLSGSRRYLMTLERHWPNVHKILSPVNYHPVDASQWHTNAALCEEILAEWQRTKLYLEADFIRELNPHTCRLVR